MTVRARTRGPVSVTPEQVAAFRVSRHHLEKRAPGGSLVPVVSDILGVQAQLPSAAQIALHQRVGDVTPGKVEEALWKHRSLVRAWCMRATVHLVAAQDLSLLSRTSQSRGLRWQGWLKRRGAPETALDRLVDLVGDSLEHPVTVAQLGEAVSARFACRVVLRTGGTGWGNQSRVPALKIWGMELPVSYLPHIASSRVPSCSGLPVEGEPTYVRADRWVPGWRDPGGAGAQHTLLRRYLSAYGPASLQDFLTWSGCLLRDFREAWRELQPELEAIVVEGREACTLAEDLAELRNASFSGPSVRLLPYFDTFLMGHRTRDHLAHPGHHSRISRPAGWIYPVVLARGRAVGNWRYERFGSRLQVRIQGFRPLPTAVRQGAEDEAQRLGRFLGAAKTNVRIR